MEHIIAFLNVCIMVCVIQSLPIENGFTIRFNPTSSREDFKTKKIGKIFTKVPQNSESKVEDIRLDFFKQSFLSQSSEGSKYTPPPSKISAPPKQTLENNTTEIWAHNNLNFLNLPVISQPYADYKILVAAAPPNIHLGSGVDRKKVIVYVVFPNDGDADSDIEDIPRIYFINENTMKKKKKKIVEEPMIIIDSNRTVTGLKSKEIAKFLKFKNKLTNRFDYKVD